MVSVFGTMAADVLHIGLGVSYTVSTAAFAAAVAAILALWHRSERTLDIHSISTVRRETFYWAVVAGHLRPRHGSGRPHRHHPGPGLPRLRRGCSRWPSPCPRQHTGGGA